MIRRDRPGRIVREVVLSISAVIGVVCIVATVGAALLGLRPLIFRSGSMSPTIDTGALAISKNVPSSALNVGDIVMVKTVGGTNVTHRIVTVTHRSRYATVALKGDANKAADAQAYDVANADRVLFSIPKAGYAVMWLAGPIGLFLLGLYAAFLVFVLFVNSGRGRGGDPDGKVEPSPGSGGGRRAQRTSRRVRGRSAVVLLIAAGIATGSVSSAGPTWALPWTDAVTVSGTTLTAGTIAAPATFTCGGLGLGSVTVDWASVSGATSYTVFWNSGASSADVGTATSRPITGSSGGSKTAWVVANHNYGSTTWTSVASTTRTYSIILFVLGVCN